MYRRSVPRSSPGSSAGRSDEDLHLAADEGPVNVAGELPVEGQQPIDPDLADPRVDLIREGRRRRSPRGH